MGITEQAEKHLKGKSVIIVTNSLDSDGYVQEIAGTLLEAIDNCFVLGQLQEKSPTLVNAHYVAWIYEDEGDNEADEEEL
jgi:hypothetical protein